MGPYGATQCPVGPYGALWDHTGPPHDPPFYPPPQSACTYGALRYERWALWGCPIGSDPRVLLPVALSCRCARCPMATSDCTVQGLGPAFCGAPGGFGGE